MSFLSVMQVSRKSILRTPPWALFALTLFLTFTATYFIHIKDQAEEYTNATMLTNRAVNEIDDRMQVYINALNHTRSFFQANEDLPNRQEFSRFVASLNLDERYPGIQGIGFSQKLSPEDLQQHIESVQKQGFSGYNVWPDVERKEYTAILYLEPFTPRNQRAFGYDMSTDPVRNKAMSRARDTGFASLTTRVQLVQETNNDIQKGFLIYLPFYKPGLPVATTEQRKQALVGYIYSPFRANDLFSEITEDINGRGDPVAIQIFDGREANKDSLLYSSFGINSDVLLNTKNAQYYQLELGGHEWTAAIAPVGGLANSGHSSVQWVILLFGIIISLLILLFSHMAQERARSLQKNENQIRLIIQSLPLYLAYIDNEERLQFHNQQFEDSGTGKLVGRSFVEVTGSEYYSKIQTQLRKSLAGEELRFETHSEVDGVRQYSEITCIPDKNSKGEVRGVIFLSLDVTERKQFEARLREERRISETVSDVGLSLRAEMRLEELVQKITDSARLLTNAKFGAFYYKKDDEKEAEDYSLAAVSGLPADENSQSYLAGTTTLISKALEQRGALRYDDISRLDDFTGREFVVSKPEHSELILRSYLCVPVVSRSGVAFGAMFFGHHEAGVFTDRSEKLVEGIAAQAAVAIDNAKLYHDAQNLNRMKDEFVATLSHELRTPLNVILGHSEIIKTEGLDSAGAGASMDAIHRNAVAQHQIISDLLDISAAISGKLSFHPAKLQVSNCVASAVEGLAFTAQNKGVSLKFRDEAQNSEVLGDATRVQQIVWNLLSNSLKFTPKGGEIEVRVTEDANDCIIFVHDTGIGIDSEFLPQIFDRFRQADASFTRAFGGLGLGLSIVRHLVELHGGSISASSEGKGAGAQFEVRLPKRPHQDMQDTSSGIESQSYKSSGHELVEKIEEAPSIEGKKILAIDDDPDARQLLARILGRAQVEYQLCSSADEALTELAIRSYDAIISDIGMPEKDGLSFMQEYRRHEKVQQSFTPAIALTAFARAEEVNRAFSAGYQVHLAKPVNSRALIGAIHEIVGRSPKA